MRKIQPTKKLDLATETRAGGGDKTLATVVGGATYEQTDRCTIKCTAGC